MATLADSDDKQWLQNMGGSTIVFSRRISVVGKKYIADHWYGGPKVLSIGHKGIDDAFVGKASVIHYWHDGEWFEFAGAD